MRLCQKGGISVKNDVGRRNSWVRDAIELKRDGSVRPQGELG